ncbi:MAG: hypothetical protein ICV73_28690 [Acetobacteraceae bacterium]|nr:hypothetical protein [Acetobacteraceae bacterium]
MAGEKTGGEATPRQTYMPKPPSKEVVDQVSREQAMVTDDWTGEPAAGGAGPPDGKVGAPEGGSPGGKGGGG